MKAQRLYAACEATWPAKRVWLENGVTFRDGDGGGKRVSAATADHVPDMNSVNAAFRDQGQRPLFMIRDGDDALDRQLAAAGYKIVDPVNMYIAPITTLTDVPIPPVTAFDIWKPLAIMQEIWAQGGIGPARLRVMERATQKTAILARWNEKPAGVGFVACDRDVAMVHAVEVLPHQRRQGVARWIMRKAAFWAQTQGADWISVLCTRENTAANGLYQALGFENAGAYHYRTKEAS